MMSIRESTPENSVAERPYGEIWERLPRRRRRPGVLSILITLSVGAALAVLIVYPLLHEDAQAKILQVQQKVAELAPWLRNR